MRTLEYALFRGHALCHKFPKSRSGFPEVIEAHAFQHLRSFGELDLAVLHDLHSIALGVEKVQSRAREELNAERFKPPSHSVVVIDD